MKEEDFIIVEDEPDINLIDRWELGEEKDDISQLQFPDGLGGETSEDVDFRLLFDQFTIDKKRLMERILTMLERPAAGIA